MAKNLKDPPNTGDPNSGSGSGKIFETFFGDVPERNTYVSIFSNHNPFRRKPIDQQKSGLGFGSAKDDTENSTNGEYENPSFVEVKKRKRRDEKPIFDSGEIDEDLGTHLEIKKAKKGKGKKHDLGPELKEKDTNLGFESEEGGNHDMGVELNERVSLESKGTEKKKKKRKRDELEAVYEAQRYGVVAMDDEGGEGKLEGKIVGEKRKKIDDFVDMVVAKEGFDDEDKLLKTVFVGNLPLKVKKKALFKEFSQFGEVESVRIRSIPLLDTKKPRKGAIIQKKINDAVDSVHAYIVFETEQGAQASLAHNMAAVGGNHIRVDRACPPHKKLKGDNAPLYDNKRTVFVGNLPFDVKDEEIYQLFSGIKDLESTIEAIRVIRDSGTSAGKGIAYVLFKTRGAANSVVKKGSLKLRDRELRLCHAKPNLTPSKRKNPSPRDINGSPTKKLAVDLRTPTKAASSYQGLRASKSGVQKKVHAKVIEPVKLQFRTQKGEKLKERTRKRPAVAARRANAMNGGGDASKQVGKKRKLECQTPGSARPSKKIRKFR
ncbi:RNA-binding protein 34 [Camellia lanceoleosa]|uniref:RNA-binding protein 34 n=1 Tax=Camellia lanceoleosa TaxID=1840588 RepID=A0ACC0G061_9ERIC|nr:RNA-binding protein 34 [Camellia lanceoleosa]